MVERFNGRISEMLKQTKLSSELKQARYLRLDNHHVPQSSLGCLTPVEALKKWQKSRPHLFKKSVHNETKPDNLDSFAIMQFILEVENHFNIKT